MERFDVISAKNNYGQDVTIRTIDRDGVTWYVVFDFCKGIDLVKTQSAKAYISQKKHRPYIFKRETLHRCKL